MQLTYFKISFYELRDVRGGAIATMLEYNKGASFTSQLLWPRSRWGMMYLSVPIEIASGYICSEPDDGVDNTPIINPATGSAVEFSPDANLNFVGAFTPVDWDQHCVGRMSKFRANDLCSQCGATLCTGEELRISRKTKLGCNLDNFPLWSTTTIPKAGNQTKQFVRCCSRFSVLNICPFFSRNQIDFCSSLTTETDCIAKGTGTAKQASWGFGRLRNFYASECQAGRLNCNGMVKPWSTRDACVWCPRPGSESDPNTGGNGECRAGNDLGVCPNAPSDMQKLFVLKIKAQCESKVICRVATRYEEKAVLIDAYTPRPTVGAPTPPTLSPTSAAPMPAPTRLPTRFPRSTPKPTRRNMATPTSDRITETPSTFSTTTSDSPTTSPTASPSTSAPTQSRPRRL